MAVFAVVMESSSDHNLTVLVPGRCHALRYLGGLPAHTHNIYAMTSLPCLPSGPGAAGSDDDVISTTTVDGMLHAALTDFVEAAQWTEAFVLYDQHYGICIITVMIRL